MNPNDKMTNWQKAWYICMWSVIRDGSGDCFVGGRRVPKIAAAQWVADGLDRLDADTEPLRYITPPEDPRGNPVPRTSTGHHHAP